MWKPIWDELHDFKKQRRRDSGGQECGKAWEQPRRLGDDVLSMKSEQESAASHPMCVLFFLPSPLTSPPVLTLV